MWKQITDAIKWALSVTRKTQKHEEDVDANVRDIKDLYRKHNEMSSLMERVLLFFEHNQSMSEQAQKLLKTELALMLSQAVAVCRPVKIALPH